MIAARAADALPPLAFALLAGLTPPDVATAFYDERLEPLPLDQPTDLVAFSVDTFAAQRAYHLAAHYRQRGIPVVMGGYHPTCLPAEALIYADAIVIGDAEGVWPQVVADARAGRLQRVYRQGTPLPLHDLPFDRRIFAGKRYPAITLVQTSRGCRFACDFCSIHAFYGTHRRQRPLTDILAELERLKPRHVLFIDDNLFSDFVSAKALFTALRPLRLRWMCQISLEIANYPELLDLMAASGCVLAMIGFESLQAANLRQMHKTSNLQTPAYLPAIRAFQARGIMVYGAFVFGYDHDTPAIFDRTLEFALTANFFLANFNLLMPMPGTPLYQRLHQEKRLLYECWWRDPAYRYGAAAFQPRGMSAAQLAEGCFRLRREYFRYASIARRSIEIWPCCRDLTEFGLFWAANLVARKEILRKQDIRLGIA